ncbi:hypothetical protein [Bacillus sp. NEAU-Y102]
MRLDDTCYLVGLGILACFEFFFAIPLMLDSLINAQATWAVMAVGVAHVFMLMYAKSGVVEVEKGSIHVLGIAAAAMSFIPVLGFILHVPVTYQSIKHILKVMKPKQEVEELGVKDSVTLRERLGNWLISKGNK